MAKYRRLWRIKTEKNKTQKQVVCHVCLVSLDRFHLLCLISIVVCETFHLTTAWLRPCKRPLQLQDTHTSPICGSTRCTQCRLWTSLSSGFTLHFINTRTYSVSDIVNLCAAPISVTKHNHWCWCTRTVLRVYGWPQVGLVLFINKGGTTSETESFCGFNTRCVDQPKWTEQRDPFFVEICEGKDLTSPTQQRSRHYSAGNRMDPGVSSQRGPAQAQPYWQWTFFRVNWQYTLTGSCSYLMSNSGHAVWDVSTCHCKKTKENISYFWKRCARLSPGCFSHWQGSFIRKKVEQLIKKESEQSCHFHRGFTVKRKFEQIRKLFPCWQKRAPERSHLETWCCHLERASDLGLCLSYIPEKRDRETRVACTALCVTSTCFQSQFSLWLFGWATGFLGTTKPVRWVYCCLLVALLLVAPRQPVAYPRSLGMLYPKSQWHTRRARTELRLRNRPRASRCFQSQIIQRIVDSTPCAECVAFRFASSGMFRQLVWVSWVTSVITGCITAVVRMNECDSTGCFCLQSGSP